MTGVRTAVSPSLRHPNMPPDSNDPNTHVPDIAPADVWDDAEHTSQERSTLGTTLPPIRVRPETPNGRDEGLRIGPISQQPQPSTPELRLEVQEINGTVIRLDPETSDVVKVPRHVKFHERPAVEEEDPHRRGEGKDWGNPRKYPLPWVIGTSLGVSTLIILAMLALPRVNKSNAATTRPDQTGVVLDTADEVKDSDDLNRMFSLQPEAERMFRAFARATIVDDMLVLVRDQKTVEPLIRSKPIAPPAPRSWDIAGKTTWNVSETAGLVIGILEGPLPDQAKFRAYFTFAENRLVLDWKATTGYGTATFDELERTQGDISEIRGTILPSGLYTMTFPETEFQNYQLVSPDNQTAIWCYCRRGELPDTEIGRLIMGGEIVKTTPEPQRVTLRLEKAPAGSLPNQWLIKEVLHKDWISR